MRRNASDAYGAGRETKELGAVCARLVMPHVFAQQTALKIVLHIAWQERGQSSSKASRKLIRRGGVKQDARAFEMCYSCLFGWWCVALICSRGRSSNLYLLLWPAPSPVC